MMFQLGDILEIALVEERVEMRLDHVRIGLRGMEYLGGFHKGELGVRVRGLRSEVLLEQTSFVGQVLSIRDWKGDVRGVVSAEAGSGKDVRLETSQVATHLLFWQGIQRLVGVLWMHFFNNCTVDLVYRNIHNSLFVSSFLLIAVFPLAESLSLFLW
jgi:hypothetical protein